MGSRQATETGGTGGEPCSGRAQTRRLYLARAGAALKRLLAARRAARAVAVAQSAAAIHGKACTRLHAPRAPCDRGQASYNGEDAAQEGEARCYLDLALLEQMDPRLRNCDSDHDSDPDNENSLDENEHNHRTRH